MAQKVWQQPDLVNYIMEFDGTYRENFRQKMVYNLYLINHVRDFWYNKYRIFLLENNIHSVDGIFTSLHINYILDIQDLLIDISRHYSYL